MELTEALRLTYLLARSADRVLEYDLVSRGDIRSNAFVEGFDVLSALAGIAVALLIVGG